MSRLAIGHTKMGHGTMGGESRVATRAWINRNATVGGGVNPCECLLWRPDNYDDEIDEIVEMFGYGMMSVIGDRIYTFGENFDAVVSIALNDHFDIQVHLQEAYGGYMTADGSERLWFDGYIEGIDDPSGLIQCIHPVDDPSESLVCFTHVSGGSQVAGTFYQGVTRWFGWHPADGNFYHWQQWRQPGTVFSPTVYNKGRMYQITPAGAASLVFEFTARSGAQGESSASDYRRWVPTKDGGLWVKYRDPILKGDYWFRRYDVLDGFSYQDFTDIDATPYDFWPTLGADDSITAFDHDLNAHPTPFKFKDINASGAVSDSVHPCIVDDLMNGSAAAWSPLQDRVVVFGWDYDLPEPESFYNSTFDLGGNCSPQMCTPEWSYVRGKVGDGANSFGGANGDVSCAIDFGATFVYVADRNTDCVWRLNFPALDNRTLAYTAPAGYNPHSVTVGPNGPLVCLTLNADGSCQIRDFADNIIYDSAPLYGPSTTSWRMVWNHVYQRLYLLHVAPGGGGGRYIYSMEADGSDVQTEYSPGPGGGVDPWHGLMVTSDGAIWFNATPSAGTARFAVRFDRGNVWDGPPGVAYEGLALPPTRRNMVLQTNNTSDSTDMHMFEGSGINTDTYDPDPTLFNGWSLIQCAVTPDFRKAVAFASGRGGVDASLYAWWIMDCP